jgi:RimJ/RimL family protein N-acetyltransferase
LEHDYWLLSKAYVRKDWRGKGIFRRFLEEAVTLCRSDYNFSQVKLMVNKHNVGSIAAYLKMGFVVVETVKKDIGGGFSMDDYVMEMCVED